MSEAHKLLDQQQQLNLSSQKLLESPKTEQNIKEHAVQSRENTYKDDQNDIGTSHGKQSCKPSNGLRKSLWKRLFK